MTTARSVMTDSVVSVDPELSLPDVLRLLVEEDVHGAPVVGEDGELVGVISTTDLLRSQDEDDFQDRLARRTVSDVMSSDFVAVHPDAPVSEVARCLRENRVHRVWVVERGRLCGVVSALDLMAVIETGEPA